ncbi:Uncharacterised protein [Mycobacteroides abscessus subsp. abscessus]|nr:Uncharacterised protein [Mycobacteroides abscessus subsp. abscessus]
MQRGALSARRFFHDDGVFVGEAADAADQVDPIALQLGAHHLDLLADDMLGAGQQILRGDVGLHAVAGAVQLALVHARQIEHRLAQCLGRNGPGIGADATEHVVAFDDRHRLAELGRGDGGLLASGAGPDDDEIVGRSICCRG